jgi:preprotein translocase subunit SecG
MEKILKIIQFVTSILIIIVVLLQGKNSSLSNLFGESSNFYTTKRGAEKFLFYATIVVSVIFVAAIVANMFIK